MSTYAPPTAAQLTTHLARHPGKGPPTWVTRAPLIALVGLVVLAALLYQTAMRPLVMGLPWLALLGIIGWTRWRVVQVQSLERELTDLQEQAMLRRHPEALAGAWSLLPRLDSDAVMRARAVALIGHMLDLMRADDAALVAYNDLLERTPPDHPAGPPLRIQRAIAMLRSDRLSDADEDLRRLRPLIDRHPSSTLAAAYVHAQLVQDVITGHHDDAVKLARENQGLIDQLRPLGTAAGYGHALIAWCYHHAAPDDPAGPAAWQHAILLLPPSAIVYRFPELSPLTDAAPAKRQPVAPPDHADIASPSNPSTLPNHPAEADDA